MMVTLRAQFNPFAVWLVSEQVDSRPHHPSHCHNNSHGGWSCWTGNDQGMVLQFGHRGLCLDITCPVFVNLCMLECAFRYVDISASAVLCQTNMKILVQVFG